MVHSDIITEYFCCNLSACHGQCCIEGDAGAPLTAQESEEIRRNLSSVWDELTEEGKTEIDRNGISYIDREGDLVTSIIRGRNCVFTCTGEVDGIKDVTLCALECARHKGHNQVYKPISCALYPIREKQLGEFVGLNYHQWDICQEARALGEKLKLPVYKFLREPLVHRFGEDWYRELEEVAEAYLSNKQPHKNPIQKTEK